MLNTFTYRNGAELPGLRLPWEVQDDDGQTWLPLDLSTGHTFTLQLVNTRTEVDAAPAATVAGYDGGVTVTWDTGALDIAPGTYALKVRARETSTLRDRDYAPGDEPRVRIV